MLRFRARVIDVSVGKCVVLINDINAETMGLRLRIELRSIMATT